MSRTTPPRPLDVEALFPELSAYRGTTTRLHPRPGRPDVADSSVGGPLLWPVHEPWPVCTESHRHSRGRRPADIHRYRQILASAWRREPGSGPTDEERLLLKQLDQGHRVEESAANSPLPLIGLAQLYRRDIPDLPAGPDGCDLLQVFWCPFDAHGPTGYGMLLDLRWHRSWEVTEVQTSPPQPQVVGSEGYVPEACVLHPEQVATYPFAGLLPEDLCARIDAWEEALEEEAEQSTDEDAVEPVSYQYDLSIPPGWRAGGFASWHTTDPSPMNCRTCSTPMDLLLTIDSSEWDGGSGSWKPLEEQGLPARLSATPTEVTVGRWGELNIFTCPEEPTHPHRWSIQ
ncbi:hypothetical protein [Streptomyces nodosus]|uniref:DUF1963 domain-containing protein n=1 Tax=Streptomyces nodosus TaxID=40318 RepID=A0A0B5DTD4_9ACTN|nr:hypothetical protein [Streptomyces nodosus]AJE43362.1 hypothetical protein SNOD_27515 [Streptomyces nodosus]MBB4794796.1 hypothetical protein [Streptomyces nodosus]QEV41858.1 hypothetical protein CP978_27800 [Streptomyces nodosus]